MDGLEKGFEGAGRVEDGMEWAVRAFGGLSHKRDDAYRLLPGFGLHPRAGLPQ